MNRSRTGFLLWAAAVLFLGLSVLGCGGAVPDDDQLLGIQARCVDGTLITNLDSDGCDFHGGVDETYIGGDDPRPKPIIPIR